ncbi:MAG: hypothetical protein HXX16_06340 [Bacteroidales bacterium]|nr:hypothetical protein [Bacteroidales bacterium]
MKVNNSKHLKIPTDDQVIWRYYDFPKFASLIYEEALWFSRVDYLTDKYEGELPHENADEFVENLRNVDPYMPLNERIERGLNEIKNVRKFKKFTYVSSWSMNKEESFALWKIYLNNSKQGIAIKTTVGNIRKSFLSNDLDCVIGQVEYSNKVEEVNQDSINGTKKPYYEYEKEFRIFIKNQFNIKTDENGKQFWEPFNKTGLSIKIDLENLIERVVMSPFCEDWFIDLVRKMVKDRFPTKNLIIQKSRIMDE